MGGRTGGGGAGVSTGGRVTSCVSDKSRDLKADELSPRSADRTARGRPAAIKQHSASVCVAGVVTGSLTCRVLGV